MPVPQVRLELPRDPVPASTNYAEVAISTDGSVSSSTTCRRLVLVAAFPLPVGERFFLAAAGGAGGRGDEALSRLGGEMRAMAEMGTGVAAASSDRTPARTERREPTGHSRQPRSSMSRVASSAESAAAAAGAALGGGAVALRGTEESERCRSKLVNTVSAHMQTKGTVNIFDARGPLVRALKRPKPNGIGTEWHGGTNQDALGHTGVDELFRGMEVRHNFHNGTQVKPSLFLE
ncbi:hypothetical protein SEVIR_2G056575v4 [Setaria viridis]